MPFRKFLIALVAALLLSSSLRADGEPAAAPIPHVPLGSSPQEIADLYGPVLRHNARVRRHQILEGGTVIDGDLYSRNGLVIRVVFHGDHAVLIEYTRVAGTLTPEDANVLLAANSVDSVWVPGKDNTDTNRYYRRTDGKALAHYATEYDGSLLIAAENAAGGDLFTDRIVDPR